MTEMTTPPVAANATLTGVILAGGRARRMGGIDKGLVEVAGRPLIAHVIDAIEPQVDRLMINANRNLESYQAFGYPVIADQLDDFQGPLAGMASALDAATSDLVLCVPCDSPLLPHDLAARLLDARTAADADIAVAFCDRLQPVFALLRRVLLPDLRTALVAGERKIDRWYDRHNMVTVDFSDRPQGFLNINTPAQRDELESLLMERP